MKATRIISGMIRMIVGGVSLGAFIIVIAGQVTNSQRDFVSTPLLDNPALLLGFGVAFLLCLIYTFCLFYNAVIEFAARLTFRRLPLIFETLFHALFALSFFSRSGTGNPYMTGLLCGILFALMIRNAYLLISGKRLRIKTVQKDTLDALMGS